MPISLLLYRGLINPGFNASFHGFYQRRWVNFWVGKSLIVILDRPVPFEISVKPFIHEISSGRSFLSMALWMTSASGKIVEVMVWVNPGPFVYEKYLTITHVIFAMGPSANARCNRQNANSLRLCSARRVYFWVGIYDTINTRTYMSWVSKAWPSILNAP